MSREMVEAAIGHVDEVHAYLSAYHPELMARLGDRALSAIEEAEASIIAKLPQGLKDPVGAEIRQGSDWLLVKLFVRGRPATAFVEGFDGEVDVRAHLREMRQAFGRPISPVEVPISEYVRRLQTPAHPLQALAGEAIAHLVAALEAETHQAAQVLP
ncbi:MAG: hypothetical protein HY055_12700 [Magnetospirillum sp.]|nr:hypothetical protein [Magnetospirillum sp.]